MRKKLKECGGFTMVEMLCVVAILVLLCLMVDSGLSLAMRSYRDIVAESETQLLLNDLSDALSDKLRYAIVTVKKTKQVDGTIKTDCTFSLEGVALLKGGEVKNIKTPATETTSAEYYDKMIDDKGKVVVGTNEDGDPKRLLSSGAYGSELLDGKRRYEMIEATITWDNGEPPADPDAGLTLNDLQEGQILTFHITLKVTDRWGPVSEEKQLTVRCMNPVKKEV